MYFPDYNAYLVPAETLHPIDNQNIKRRRPMANLIRLIQQRRVQVQQANSNVSNAGMIKNVSKEENNNRPNRPLKQLTTESDNVGTSGIEEIKKLQPDILVNEPNENKGYIFGQIFQRPENPVLPAFPNRPQFQINRPLISSYLPPGLTGWRPFGNLFQQQYAETPRHHYVQYLTKSSPMQSHAYYFDEFAPRVPKVPIYTDDVQDFVSHIEESVMKETSNTDGDSSMMLASVPVGKNSPTSLLLRPVAKAVAGAKGVAVASPVAKAVLRKGENVNIDFDPDAVAIAGPGGQAHAHPKLVISYTNDTKQE